jgi:hypothetical protein
MKATPQEVVEIVLNSGVAVAIVAVIGQSILAFINKAAKSDKIGEQETENPPIPDNLFEELLEVQHIIDRLLNKTTLHSVHIMKTENSGGRPRIGNNIYISILYEGIKGQAYSSKEDYQKMLVDEPYVRLLNTIGTVAPAAFKVDEMEEGMLKRIFDNVGIKYVEMYFIGETDTAFYYLSISTTEEDYEIDKIVDRVEIEIAINKLRNTFNRIVGEKN